MNRIQRRFEKYHEKNPDVWGLFKKFSFQLIDKGRQHYSARAVFDRIRWEAAITTEDDNYEFKIANDYSPYYARMFMAEFPECDGFFITRALASL